VIAPRTSFKVDNVGDIGIAQRGGKWRQMAANGGMAAA
jgi:hypothetical protein